MGSSSREEIVEVFGVVGAGLNRLCELSFDVFTTPELLRALEHLERMARQLRAPQHELINQLDAHAGEEELGGTLRTALADRLRITKAEAGQRIHEAADLGPRRALTGEPLAPVLMATATAQRKGLIGDGHIRVIRSFFAHLPAEVDPSIREDADADLADKASQYRPDELATYAQRIMDYLNPDGELKDEERARKRGITIGKQEHDLMSRISGYLTPQARATLEPVLAKLAAPGACNPDDDTPVIDDTPDADAVRRDSRSQAQRNHDGLLAGLRALIASGDLGQHNGLPVSIVVTTTLKDLEAATGTGFTGGGSRLPMSDVIRMASHGAHHYLAIFEDAKPLALYHTKRFASPGQRIMLYAKDRGCSKPGCDAPAYHSQVHHVSGWTTTGRTDINDLTLACGPDNRLAEKGWTTRTNTHGDTEWLPPPHLDHGQPRINTFHHPEKLFSDGDDEEDNQQGAA
jgi:hypothetical protein